MRWFLIFLVFLGVFFVALQGSKAEGAVYWHFTLQAQKDQEEEWLWVTLKEIPKSVFFQDIDQRVKSMGGKGLQGAVLVQVRAKAWREAFRVEEGISCDTYIPSYGRHIEYWNASWSNWVFCEGQIIPPSETEEALGFSGYFLLGLRRPSDVSKILARERRFLVLNEYPGEELKGPFNIFPIEYQDPLAHYEDTCQDKKWAKHFRSLFMHFSPNSLRSGYRPVGLGFATTCVFNETVITYSLYRSHSPQHRFFGKKIANFDRVREITILQEEAAEEALLGEETTESGEEVMIFTPEEIETEINEEEMIVFTEEEITEYGEEDMVFTPEEVDLLEEEGLEVTWDEEEVMDFTEEETH